MGWWERYPGELEREVDELQLAGMSPVASVNDGKVSIQIRLRLLGEEVNGTIIYPDLYPYFRPTLLVQGLDSNLRHYDPCSGQVCLLQRGTEHWLPQTTAAQHILQMLPHWEQAAVRQYQDSRIEGEDSQAEPASVYYPAIQGQYLFIDSSWQLPANVDSGRITIALPHGHKSILPNESFAGWVCRIVGAEKNSTPLSALSPPLLDWLQRQAFTETVYPWKRLQRAPVASSAGGMADTIAAENSDVHAFLQREATIGRSGIYGFCFPEENPFGGFREGWIFLAYHCDLRKKRLKQPYFSRWIIRAEYAGEGDLFQRVPELQILRERTVAVIGLGCIGAPSALAFARAGIGELRLLDGDYVSPGTACRWPLGLPAAGAGKVRVISSFISSHYPFTKIGEAHRGKLHREGRMVIGASDDFEQWECLTALLDGVDLVYDASAERGVNALLAELASSRGIPYISVASRSGGWGGDIVRINPDSTQGCYCCYLHALHAGDIPHPPHDPKAGALQPVGCGDVTFQAAGFDVEEIALAGVRTAVSTLCETSAGGYPPVVNDVGVVTLRRDGQMVFPEWQSYPLPVHPSCVRCNK
ncbi:ThiF family adenylyltransferase [Geomonas nitrogeniifigens]|uniref:ThiF family adenylyltransferase n=1 Tax=Geomonas diazotrophica TaxID=2843197 RepID=UPI001C2C4A2C|nr:ThiF family adenylyltransferase [Geomonas nitrogeniifigens]QXE85557.1 ThiF family adenylyltransferase [Geomonas nitrogeniifigens]